MKHVIKFATFFLIAGFVYVSCKKEYSCEDCRETNKAPIANAGKDTIIILPKDSVILDGSASSDPDGTISRFQWTKIAGPASFSIINSSIARQIVKNVVAGIYQFELKVTDNGGLSAKDTVQIIVNDPSQPNRPPIANAGADQTITLPNNAVNLDGSGSTDPENNITNYTWAKIAGPLSFNIPNASAKQTKVTNLVQGTYQFELKVTDVGGLFSKDTVQVTVNPVSSNDCDISNRPLINAQLIQVGTIPKTRWGMAVTSVGNKIIFAGGFTVYGYTPLSNISRVDIYDVITNSWSTAELSQPRSRITTAVLGNKVFFAGGSSVDKYSSRVDIYDVATNTWTTTELSSGAILSAGAAAGDKVLFAGGFREYGPSRRVDIYDVSTNTWSKDSLTNRKPQATDGIAATLIGEKIYFAGASEWAWDFGENSSTINIYDVAANTWSISYLKEPRGYMAAIAVGNKNYWAGGNGYPDNPAPSNQVEIRDMNTGASSFACLFQSNAYFSAVQQDNKIAFFTGAWGGLITNKFDIYNITTDSWSIGVLHQDIEAAAIISVNNTNYVAGGIINGDYRNLSNQVWKLEF